MLPSGDLSVDHDIVEQWVHPVLVEQVSHVTRPVLVALPNDLFGDGTGDAFTCHDDLHASLKGCEHIDMQRARDVAQQHRGSTRQDDHIIGPSILVNDRLNHVQIGTMPHGEVTRDQCRASLVHLLQPDLSMP